MTTTERPHGRAKYVMEKCHCDVCREANNAYARSRERQRGYGRPAYLDAEPARRHLRALSEAGIGWRRAAELAGLSSSVVHNVLWGRPGRVPARQVRAATAKKILAVEATPDNVADGSVIDAVGTRRRLQALVAIGWSQAKLGERIGVTPANMTTLIKAAQVKVATARAVRALYDELWDTPPLAASHHQKIAYNRSRRYAEEHGWVPPLAWDDDEIDNPDAEPAGAAEPRHNRGGQPKLPPADELRWLLTQQSRLSVAQRYGVRPSAIAAALQRSA